MKRWFIFPMALAAGLAACTPTMQEDIDYMVFKEKQRWNSQDRAQEFRTFFGIDEVFHGPYMERQQAERDTCITYPQQYRSVTQDGISDSFDYTWCMTESSAADEGGSRMDNRPMVGG